ncbi:hypothetical protein [Pseudoxanthomonas kalamensis]|nr:hypothetical protein [Pseudoxanthomonas kalamensis]
MSPTSNGAIAILRMDFPRSRFWFSVAIRDPRVSAEYSYGTA